MLSAVASRVARLASVSAVLVVDRAALVVDRAALVVDRAALVVYRHQQEARRLCRERLVHSVDKEAVESFDVRSTPLAPCRQNDTTAASASQAISQAIMTRDIMARDTTITERL